MKTPRSKTQFFFCVVFLVGSKSLFTGNVAEYLCVCVCVCVCVYETVALSFRFFALFGIKRCRTSTSIVNVCRKFLSFY